MKHFLLTLCWFVSLGILSLHAESPDRSRPLGLDLPRSTPTSASTYNEPPRRFVAISFGAPQHQIGHAPATGFRADLPSGLTGNPQVVAATAALPNQPLLLNTELANGPCCYEEGIQVLVNEEAQQYAISFDLATQQLGDSFNQFQLWLNDASAPLLRFQPDYQVVLDQVGAIAGFGDDQRLHISLLLDIEQGQLELIINDVLLYQGEYLLDSLHSLQFLMTAEGGATPEQVNPEASAALDNILVANGSYRYTNLHADLQRSTETTKNAQELALQSRVRNNSNQIAEEVSLVHLLPPGTRVIRLTSNELDCDVIEDLVRCYTDQLSPMAQATLLLTLENTHPKEGMDISVMATSPAEDIDSSDNYASSHFAGSSSLLFLLSVLLLWWMMGQKTD